MKFRFKITLCMLAIVSSLFAVGGSLLISESFEDTLQREKDAAFDVYRMVWNTLQIVNGLDPYLDPKAIRQTMEQLCQQTGQKRSAWLALQLKTAEEILYETDGAAAFFPARESLPAPGECMFFTTLGSDNTHCLVLSSAAITNNNDILYLNTAYDISTPYAMRQIQQQTYLQVFCVLLLLCAGLSYSVSRLLTAPLQRLSHASRAIASGQLSSRVKVRSDDEIGMVGEDFNTMAEQLEDKISELANAIKRQERFR